MWCFFCDSCYIYSSQLCSEYSCILIVLAYIPPRWAFISLLIFLILVIIPLFDYHQLFVLRFLILYLLSHFCLISPLILLNESTFYLGSSLIYYFEIKSFISSIHLVIILLFKVDSSQSRLTFYNLFLAWIYDRLIWIRFFKMRNILLAFFFVIPYFFRRFCVLWKPILYSMGLCSPYLPLYITLYQPKLCSYTCMV